jgi:hypothetical protein
MLIDNIFKTSVFQVNIPSNFSGKPKDTNFINPNPGGRVSIASTSLFFSFDFSYYMIA